MQKQIVPPFLPRILAVFLSLAPWCLPVGPVFALRGENVLEAGMEERITQALGHPAAGLEELGRTIPKPFKEETARRYLFRLIEGYLPLASAEGAKGVFLGLSVRLL